MKRDLALLKDAIKQLEKQAAGPKPLVNNQAPNDDAEAVEVFVKARVGDANAQAQVRGLIRRPDWVNWIGDLGRQATHQLIHKAAGADAVWKAGISEKANALHEELIGEKPSVLENLLVRRVVNGRIAIHAWELELLVRPPSENRHSAYPDAALTRAQKRFTEAVRELARIRRLQVPKILAQLNLAASPAVVNATGSGPLPKV